MIGHLPLDLPEDPSSVIERASRDVEAFLGWPARTEGGPRIRTSDLTVGQLGALTEAVAEQVAFRLVLGEEEITEGRPRVLGLPGGPTFASDAPDLIAPMARRVLAGSGLLRHAGTVT